jgi:hypothetical protein
MLAPVGERAIAAVEVEAAEDEAAAEDIVQSLQPG